MNYQPSCILAQFILATMSDSQKDPFGSIFGNMSEYPSKNVSSSTAAAVHIGLV